MKLLLLILICWCCSQLPEVNSTTQQAPPVISPAGMNISSRFSAPDSFSRISTDSATFAYYLQHLPLKSQEALVKYYNGDMKPKNDVYCAVVDMDISPVDLQQCADAVMRLRGEYLFNLNKYDEISFRFTGDGKMHGFREYANKDYSYKKFRKYMDYVFGYANTASLKKQLKPVPFSSMRIGDVLVQSGNPYGHAVIVVDMCRNNRGEIRYMLAQSYMPAQETQILLNPGTDMPWYEKPERSTIATPEWTFDTTDLRRW